MSERRRQVLDTIQRAAEPVGVSEIANQLGIHPNTVRFHLEALEGDGIVERVPDTPSGPGRPRTGYRARPGLARGGARRYRVLAEILLSHLSATSDDPATAATAAGRAWGAHLVPRPAPSREVTRDDAVNRLTAMLRDLDFAPEPVDGRRRVNRPDPPAALPVPRTRRTAPRPRLPRAPGPDAGRADRTPRTDHGHRTDPLRRDHRVPGPPHARPRPPRGTMNVVDAAGPPTRHQRRSVWVADRVVGPTPGRTHGGDRDPGLRRN